MNKTPRTGILEQDVQSSVNQIEPIVKDLEGSRVLITGATGLLGSLAVRVLLAANEQFDLNMAVIAMGRNSSKLISLFGPETNSLLFAQGNIRDALHVNGIVTHIIHGASATSSRYFVEHPAETIATAIDGTRNILNLAREKNIAGMVYLSSLEVYGNMGAHDDAIKECESGHIDPLSVRSSYSESKRLCETLCAAYAKEFLVPVKVARLSQTFGAGVDYEDGRVFAEFMRCAMEGRDITLHSRGATVRTYCYTADAIAAILYILVRGNIGEAYNVSNEDTAISILDMAKLVASDITDGDISVLIDIPENVEAFGYNPEMIVKLDCEKIRSLGWRASTNLTTMFNRMIAHIRETRS